MRQCPLSKTQLQEKRLQWSQTGKNRAARRKEAKSASGSATKSVKPQK